MTFLSPLLFVGIALFVGFLASMDKDVATQIAIHDETGMFKNDFKSDKNIHYINISFMPFQTAKDTAKNNYDGLLYIPKVDSIQQLAKKVEYISEDSPSIDFISDVEHIVDSTLTSDKLTFLLYN